MVMIRRRRRRKGRVSSSKREFELDASKLVLQDLRSFTQRRCLMAVAMRFKRGAGTTQRGKKSAKGSTCHLRNASLLTCFFLLSSSYRLSLPPFLPPSHSLFLSFSLPSLLSLPLLHFFHPVFCIYINSSPRPATVNPYFLLPFKFLPVIGLNKLFSSPKQEVELNSFSSSLL
eukprot:749709-Hanusia_phi.AAC.2